MASKWLNKARQRMEEKSTVGSLREASGAKKGRNIPAGKLDQMSKRYKGQKGSDGKLDPHAREMLRKIQFAKNANK